jgi:RimJ/RimL family protein N-acetyltransferase
MLIGERIRFRSVERGDLPYFIKWFDDPEVTEFLKVEGPMSLEDEEDWLERTNRTGGHVYSFETLDGKLIGNLGLMSLNWISRKVEIGVVIGEKEYWSKGYGTEAISLMLRFLFEEWDVNRVELFADSRNLRAIRCYERCGFRKEGVRRQNRFKRGEYVDDVHMAVLRSDWEERQA